MVAIPVTNDQPAIAARIAYTQTGTVIPFRRLNPVRLRHAIRQVLENARFGENARRLQSEIQAVNGLERAADIIEKSFNVRSAKGSNASPGR
jgi:UDP:flavonoid glycosyltransferase YjiC (YdhE family)